MLDEENGPFNIIKEKPANLLTKELNLYFKSITDSIESEFMMIDQNEKHEIYQQ